MWPLNRGRRRTDEEDKLKQSVAYDQISKDSKDSNLIMLYDEASILLFEKPKKKVNMKKL